MKEIKVNFQTLTPLWTGDAWGENNEIRPSSIMGSLRFWFEVICYFSGITNNGYYDNGKLKDKLDEKALRDEVIKNGNNFDGIDKLLAGFGMSLPSRVFGCTGWKGWIGIKKIDYTKNNFKNNLKGRIINNKNWFWGTPHYEGSFSLIFKVEENIIDSIFYPLLNFIEKYGFLGGKWNLGYGRVKIEKIKSENVQESKWRKEEFYFGKFNKNSTSKFENNITFNDSVNENSILQAVSDFSELTKSNNRIKILENQTNNQTQLEEIIKQLIKIKSIKRRKEENAFSRHLLFGTTQYPPERKDLPQGTKIIPWIYEEDGKLKGGFVSIAGILNLGG